jgi:ATP-binding cassette subfamily B (MDR/TAP) protein 1
MPVGLHVSVRPQLKGLNNSELCFLGGGIFICTYVYMFVWVYTGEMNAKPIREKCLQAVLRQDNQFFDVVGAGEVATRIQTDTR